MAKKYINDVRFWLLAIIVFGGGFALHPRGGFSIFGFPSPRGHFFALFSKFLPSRDYLPKGV